MRTHRVNLAILAFAVVIGSSCSREVAPKPSERVGLIYVTRKTLEPDKLASIWLMKRYVDKEAKFEFVEDDVPLTNGIPFDTPEAEFRRYATLSCYESILKKHQIRDPALIHIGQLIHDIEINYWGEKRFVESGSLNREVREIIENSLTNRQTCLEKSFTLFDRMLRTAQTNAPVRGLQ